MRTFRAGLGQDDVLFITLDTLRYDVAQEAWAAGRTPNFASLLPLTGWEARHTPGSFTLAAHQAFFAGFLPTPIAPGRHVRPWSLRFAGSETTGADTLVFDAPHIPAGYAAHGYRTICIGGTGFFNTGTELGRVLPGHFNEAHWSPRLGVADPRSPNHQFALAAERLAAIPPTTRTFLFINVGATHRPTHIYLPGAQSESRASQMAALQAVDRALPVLLAAVRARGRCRGIICADHGTCHGEDGYHGHRLAHPIVWTVPYADIEVAS